VFFEKNLGTIELTEETVIKHERLMPDDEAIAQSAIAELKARGPTHLDMEGFYSSIEQAPFFGSAIESICRQSIDSVAKKVQTALFIVSLRFRHPEVLRYLHEGARGLLDVDRWVTLLGHYSAFSDTDWQHRQVLPLARAKWICHASDTHRFPLTDWPAMEDAKVTKIWVTLSPRLILEVCLNTKDHGGAITHRVDERRDRSLLRYYPRLCLRHMTRQVISHDPLVLNAWRDIIEYRERRDELQRPPAM
jgi:hypothetical protein